MTQLTPFQLSLNGASWIDVNTQLTLNNLPDRIPDDVSITFSSLYNLFNCNIGERGKTFEPEYGSEWRRHLQEPIDEITAARMHITMVQAIARWEPRLQLDIGRSSVIPNYDLPGYQVRIVGVTTLTKQELDIRFNEPAGQ